MKDHGNVNSELLREQIVIKKEDFKYIDDIILESDNNYYSGTTKNGKQSIIFEKIIDNRYVIVD